MRPEDKNPKTFGVSYSYCYSCLKELCEEHKINLSEFKLDLHKHYHDDLSPKDVYFIMRIKTIKAANLTLRWFEAFGREEVQFFNNEQVREFYRLNPIVKVVMEGK